MKEVKGKMKKDCFTKKELKIGDEEFEKIWNFIESLGYDFGGSSERKNAYYKSGIKYKVWEVVFYKEKK